MTVKESWKTFGTVILVIFGGMAAVFASFSFGGFPFLGDPIPQVAWLELAFLLVLLGIPLFR